LPTQLVVLSFLFDSGDLNPKRARGVKRNNPVNCSVAEWCVVVSFVPSKVTTSRQGLRSKTVSRHSDHRAVAKATAFLICINSYHLRVRRWGVLVLGKKSDRVLWTIKGGFLGAAVNFM
jgi:hypothetical protein